MEISITIGNILAMFAAAVALAIVPDSSAIAVAARSMASGIKHAAMIVVGIAVGDYVFIVIAIYGLAGIADSMGALFDIIKYLGGAYLILMGGLLWKSKPKQVEVEGITELSWLSNFLTGFFITMGDPKAIIFYMSFLPAFLDVSRATVLDVVTIMVIVTVALFGVKLTYAYMAEKARALFRSEKAKKRINLFSGSVMMATGIYLIIKI